MINQSPRRNSQELHEIIEQKLELIQLQKQKAEVDEIKNQWTFCDKHSNKHCIRFIVCSLFGLIGMVFSIIQIIRQVDNIEFYYSLLSWIIGIFMPSPFSYSPKGK